MKIVRKLISFALGVAVGAGLYALLRLRPLSPVRVANLLPRVGAYLPGHSLRVPWVQRSLPSPAAVPARVWLADHFQTVGRGVTSPSSQPRPARLATLPPAARSIPQPSAAAPIIDQSVATPSPVTPISELSTEASISAPSPKGSGLHGDRRRRAENSAARVAAARLPARFNPETGPAARLAARLAAAQVLPMGSVSAPISPAELLSEPLAVASITGPKAVASISDGRRRSETAATKAAEAHLPVAPTPAAPKVFKTIGYVEKAGAQLEAVILEDDQVKVVHLGDLIESRYRVVRVTPDSVEALDEMPEPAPMSQPIGDKGHELMARVAQPPSVPPAVAAVRPDAMPVAAKSGLAARVPSAKPESPVGGEAESAAPSSQAGEDRASPVQDAASVDRPLGYVQQANGKVQAVVADGDSVRLVPETPAVTMAKANPVNDSKLEAPSREDASTADISAPSSASASSNNREILHSVGNLRNIHNAMAFQSVPFRTISRLPEAERSAPGDSILGPAVRTAGPKGIADGREVTNIAGKPIVSSNQMIQVPVEIKPIGFVEKGDGEVAAIVSQDDEICIVRQGDRFAGHYRAVSVSASAVEAVDEPQLRPSLFVSPSGFSNSLTASVQPEASYFANDNCLDCVPGELEEVSAKAPEDPPTDVASPPPKHRGEGQVRVTASTAAPKRAARTTVKAATSPEPATFIFQTLGYVETQDGEMQAIVADGSEVYLVKQGETFADRYRATSVDPILVLAVKVSPNQPPRDIQSAQTESGGKSASNNIYGYLHYPSPGWAGAQDLHQVDASGSPVFTDLGVNLFNSASTGFDLESHFFMADDLQF